MLARVLGALLILTPITALAHPIPIDDQPDGKVRLYVPPSEAELALFEVAIEIFNECLHGKAQRTCVKPVRPVGMWTTVPGPTPPRPDPTSHCWEPFDGFLVCPALDPHRAACRLTPSDQVPNVDYCAREDPNRSVVEIDQPDPPVVEPPKERHDRKGKRGKKGKRGHDKGKGGKKGKDRDKGKRDKRQDEH